jgi:hypothetical protein
MAEFTDIFVKGLGALISIVFDRVIARFNRKYRSNFCHTINCPYKRSFHLVKINGEYRCSAKYDSNNSSMCLYLREDGEPYWSEDLIGAYNKAKEIGHLNGIDATIVDPFKVKIALIKHEVFNKKK